MKVIKGEVHIFFSGQLVEVVHVELPKRKKGFARNVAARKEWLDQIKNEIRLSFARKMARCKDYEVVLTLGSKMNKNYKNEKTKY